MTTEITSHLPMSTTEITLREHLSQRILILDGAMGTMIQQYKLTEQDYRGERFVNFAAGRLPHGASRLRDERAGRQIGPRRL